MELYFKTEYSPIRKTSCANKTHPTPGIVRPINTPSLRVNNIFRDFILFKVSVGRIFFLNWYLKRVRETSDAMEVPLVAPANFWRVGRRGRPDNIRITLSTSFIPSCLRVWSIIIKKKSSVGVRSWCV